MHTETHNDAVNHPTHYTSHPSGVEVIEITEVMDFCGGNAFKYVARHLLKDRPLQDLEKAEWYVKRMMTHPPKKSKETYCQSLALAKYLSHEKDAIISGALEAIWQQKTAVALAALSILKERHA